MVTIGPDGTLFGTTESSGRAGDCDSPGCGIVFNLHPSATRPDSVLSPWNETILHRFSLVGNDGFYPYSEVVFDAAGNLYGTTPDDKEISDCFQGTPCGRRSEWVRHHLGDHALMSERGSNLMITVDLAGTGLQSSYLLSPLRLTPNSVG